MQNLFNYSTSELSQDAFLRWLFENYQCENEIVRDAAHALLGEMTGIENLDFGTVEELKTDKQVEHTDVVVKFLYNGERRVLVIEDKTFSNPHGNQFEKYKADIETELSKDGLKHFYYAYYKTYLESQNEREEAKTCGWKSFFLDEIYLFFQKYPHSDCLIFDQYREHIAELKTKTETYREKPMKEWGKPHHEKVMFHAYIIKDLFPLVKDNLVFFNAPKVVGWHSYSSLWVERKKQDKIKFSMEISFHPAWDHANVTVRLSGYEKNEAACPSLKEWAKQELKQNNLFKEYSSEKWCIAKGKDKLSFKEGISNMTEKCKDLIDAFAEVCKSMNAELSQNPHWQKTELLPKKSQRRS